MDPVYAVELEDVTEHHVEELLRQFARTPDARAPATGSGQTMA